MSNVEKKFEETGLALIITFIIFILTLSLSTHISNGQYSQGFYLIITFSTLILVFLILLSLYYSIRYIFFLIDDYIDNMLSGKKFQPSDKFYCQVCKSVVGVDDDFCTNCGMML